MYSISDRRVTVYSIKNIVKQWMWPVRWSANSDVENLSVFCVW